MARTFTLIQLVNRCQKMTDNENATFITEADFKSWISTVFGELYSVLVNSGMQYFENEETITTDGGSTYALPDDFLTSIGVDYKVDTSGRRWELQSLMSQERNLYSGTSGASQSRAYGVIGNNVKLFPTPPTGQTYYHIYVPQPTDYSSSNDNVAIDVVTPDGENFITWGVAVMALAKEESDVTLAMAERDRALGRLEEWAVRRALNTPRRRIVDEGYGQGDDVFTGLYGSYYR